ncbi:YXWGXW repeat-containing protein [Undibacterium sp.]|uniref:YXWGXW repeat-containing protein n=1 Tax=Undibacterium sp. TaxID=1914977 RepID=UPI00374DDBB4
MIKKILLAAMLTASIGAVTAPASAEIIVRVAPPPPRTEVVPAPRRGYLWVPGHWDWRGNQHVWARGTWIRERRGYVYQEPRWTEHEGRWHYQQGAWGRGDRDHDGVPNAVDSRPNDPNRR